MSNELVTVAVFRDIPSAGLAQSILESAGITSFLDNQYTVGVNWLYSNALGGIKLKVINSSLEEATNLLNDLNKPIEPADQIDEDILHDSACPNCGDTNVVPINYKRKFAALSLLFGLPLLYFSKRFRCRKCGHKFK